MLSQNRCSTLLQIIFHVIFRYVCVYVILKQFKYNILEGRRVNGVRDNASLLSYYVTHAEITYGKPFSLNMQLLFGDLTLGISRAPRNSLDGNRCFRNKAEVECCHLI